MRRDLGRVAIRSEGERRHIEGVVVPWTGSTTGTKEYGSARESFRRGAFGDAIAKRGDRPAAYLTSHDGDPVGAIRFEQTDDGLAFSGDLLTSQAARDYAEAVEAGLDGVSLEFTPGRVARGRDSVEHVAVDQLLAVAGTWAPAYEGGHVAIRKREDPVTDQITDQIQGEPVDVPDVRVIVRGELDTFRRELAEQQAGAMAQADPYASIRAFRSLGELVRAVQADQGQTTELREVYQRALADQITTNNPGVMTPGVLGEVKRIVGQVRQGIDAFGTAPLSGSGMNVEWPYWTGNLGTLVGEQATQKTEVTTARVDILKGTSPIKTYAGASDISWQLLARSSPAYLEAYIRIMLAAYAAVTNTVFVNTVEGDTGTGKITLDLVAGGTTDAQIRQALFQASVMVKDATGSPASFVLASSSAFIRIGGALNPAGVQAGLPGDSSARTLAPELAGLPILYDPNVNAGNAVVSNGTTAKWHEDGPFQATEEEVAKLGRNVAIWGMGAVAIYNPAGIVEIGAVT